LEAIMPDTPTQPFTSDQLESLLAKLETVNFTTDERALLDAIFETAGINGDVQGFNFGMGSLQIFAKPPDVKPPTPPQGSQSDPMKTFQQALNSPTGSPS
jgi:hypothetical protein